MIQTGEQAMSIAHAAVHLRGAQQKPSELAELLRLLAKREIKTVLEIGSYAGGTIYAWQQLSDDVSVFAVDNGKAKVELGNNGVHAIIGDSHSVRTLDRVQEALDGREIDFLFIDGDHSYEGVRSDAEMYGPLVKRGGLIGFHDIVVHPKHPECKVYELWAELRGSEDTAQIVHEPATWGGIGLVFK